MKCKICGNSTSLFGTSNVMGKHPAKFYRCAECGFMQAESPYWLEEAYSKTITNSDLGLVSRNLSMAKVSMDLVSICFEPKGKFVDYGGGYGMFVRLMRDEGFDFYRQDPFCENLFSSGFEAEPNVPYDLLTAWEVFEHLIDPIAEIKKMLTFSSNIFFSTILLPTVPKPIGEWWYYGLEHGQHISFFTEEAIKIIAEKFELNLHYSNGFIHWLGKNPISPILVEITFNRHLKLLRKVVSKPRPPSLLQSDFKKITGITLNQE